MSPYDSQPARESGRTVTAVLLSVAILAVIGSVFGYVVGRRDIDSGKLNGKPGVAGGRSPTSGANGATPNPATTGLKCPEFVQTAVAKADKNAALPIYELLYIRTATEEVWICLEADGKGVWYQGHDSKGRNYPAETPVEGNNGLLVPASNAGEDQYVANHDGVTYRVYRDKLVVLRGDATVYSHPVTTARPAPQPS